MFVLLQESYYIPVATRYSIWDAFHAVADKIYKREIRSMKKTKVRPDWVTPEHWEEWMSIWDSEETDSS